MPLNPKPRALLLSLERNLLLLMIAAALVAALCVPGPGIAMKTLGFDRWVPFDPATLK